MSGCMKPNYGFDTAHPGEAGGGSTRPMSGRPVSMRLLNLIVDECCSSSWSVYVSGEILSLSLSQTTFL